MPEPADQAATQLRNIEAASGMSLDDFVQAIATTGLTKHGQIVAHLKSDHGLTHGNANLIARLAREQLEGGPVSADELLDAQYSKGKAALRPVYDKLAALASGCGDDVDVVVQKTGVSFRRATQFALVQCPSSKRVQLGLNLDRTPEDPRISETSGMCTHRVDLHDVDEIDDSIVRWIHDAYVRSGPR